MQSSDCPPDKTEVWPIRSYVQIGSECRHAIWATRNDVHPSFAVGPAQLCRFEPNRCLDLSAAAIHLGCSNPLQDLKCYEAFWRRQFSRLEDRIQRCIFNGIWRG